MPTKSARIGSSRWPRSTRTASRTAVGRPMSLSASSADRMVRPEKSTSSTSTTTLSSTPPGGMSVGSSVRAGLSRRSSRYMVTSREPTGTSYPSTAEIRSAIRSASGTPRLGMPSRTRSLAPLLRSRISWEMRVRARSMSRSSRTTRPSGAGCLLRRAARAHPVMRDLLLRLTGRLVKGCRSGVTLPGRRRDLVRTRRPAPSRVPDASSGTQRDQALAHRAGGQQQRDHAAPMTTAELRSMLTCGRRLRVEGSSARDACGWVEWWPVPRPTGSWADRGCSRQWRLPGGLGAAIGPPGSSRRWSGRSLRPGGPSAGAARPAISGRSR